MINKVFNFYNKRRRIANWGKLYKDKLIGFRNIHEGEDCFIIGNGPSLNKMELSFLNDYYCFGLNKIFLIFQRVKFNLSYLVAINKHVIEQSKDTFVNMDTPMFINNKSNSFFDKGVEHINFIELGNKVITGDITQPILEGGTVTVAAMQIAYHMGFKNIFLIGVDHSFKQKGNPHELQTMNEDDPNHFDPHYFKGQKWQLADLDFSEKSYLKCKIFFEEHGRHIYDATVGGQLDIFEKMSIDKAICKAKKK